MATKLLPPAIAPILSSPLIMGKPEETATKPMTPAAIAVRLCLRTFNLKRVAYSSCDNSLPSFKYQYLCVLGLRLCF